jgi:hypothetical protein
VERLEVYERLGAGGRAGAAAAAAAQHPHLPHLVPVPGEIRRGILESPHEPRIHAVAHAAALRSAVLVQVTLALHFLEGAVVVEEVGGGACVLLP